MDAQQFLAEFAYIAHAPNGIGKLRELVLVLAVQGRLLEQRSGEDAAAVLETTGKERQSLVASGVLRSPKSLPAITEKDRTHAVPANWCWTRFGEIALHNSGKTLDSVRNSGHPRRYITTSNLYWGRFDLSNVRQMPIRDEELEKCTARKGDLLICEGGEAGRAAVWVADEEVCFQNHIHRARFLGKINPFYAYRFFEKLNMTGEINEHRKGIGISNMSSKALAMIPFPLPPLAEQDRIVAKVDELMALCDQLEKQQQDRRKLQNALRQATLQALASAQSPHELQTSWSRLQANFGRLFSDPKDVGRLRDLVLDLAVHGLLVDQSSDDQPISAWIDSIKASRLAQAKQKLIAKPGALTDVAEDAYPFALPRGWSFVRLGQITNKIGSGSTPRGGRAVYVNEGVPFLRSQNIWNEGLRLDDVACITEEEHKRMSGTEVMGGDVLLNITGASLGRCTLIPLDFGRANVSQHVTIIRPTDPEVRRYLHLCILSPYTQSMIWGRQVGMAREGLSKKVLEQFEIPLPPIAEQRRIVARVDELMGMCDSMERQLARSLEIAERLAATSVAGITGIAVEQEEEPMKAPQIELIAPLRLATAPDVKSQAPLATILARHHGEMAARDLWQRFGGEIDAFYSQLKTEVAHGWIAEPEPAQVREKPAAETAKA